MNVELTEDQASFHEATRAFIQDAVPLAQVRALYEDPLGFDAGWFRLPWFEPIRDRLDTLRGPGRGASDR